MDIKGTFIIKQLKAYISRDLSHLGKLVTLILFGLFLICVFLEPIMHNCNLF